MPALTPQSSKHSVCSTHGRHSVAQCAAEEADTDTPAGAEDPVLLTHRRYSAVHHTESHQSAKTQEIKGPQSRTAGLSNHLSITNVEIQPHLVPGSARLRGKSYTLKLELAHKGSPGGHGPLRGRNRIHRQRMKTWQ